MASNLRQTRLGKLDWGRRTYGPALGAAGLLLGSHCRKILVSSGQSPGDRRPWGSHPLTTRFMSSSTTEVEDYGAEFPRHKKTAFIADSQVALENLHVCWVGGNETNCGRCEKCYRTLLVLELIGRRQQATSFPRQEFSLEKIKNLKLQNEVAFALFAEIAQVALEKNRPDIAAAVTACLAANQGVK